MTPLAVGLDMNYMFPSILAIPLGAQPRSLAILHLQVP